MLQFSVRKGHPALSEIRIREVRKWTAETAADEVVDNGV
jgi:hypothetical protein